MKKSSLRESSLGSSYSTATLRIVQNFLEDYKETHILTEMLHNCGTKCTVSHISFRVGFVQKMQVEKHADES